MALICDECGGDMSNGGHKTTCPYYSVLTEADPHGRNPHEPGAKLDLGKTPVMRGALQYFPRALAAVADVSLHGAQKYAWKGWEDVPNGEVRYGDALGRHLLKEEIEGDLDADSGMLHAAHTAWNALAVLELKLRRMEQ